MAPRGPGDQGWWTARQTPPMSVGQSETLCPALRRGPQGTYAPPSGDCVAAVQRQALSGLAQRARSESDTEGAGAQASAQPVTSTIANAAVDVEIRFRAHRHLKDVMQSSGVGKTAPGMRPDPRPDHATGPVLARVAAASDELIATVLAACVAEAPRIDETTLARIARDRDVAAWQSTMARLDAEAAARLDTGARLSDAEVAAYVRDLPALWRTPTPEPASRSRPRCRRTSPRWGGGRCATRGRRTPRGPGLSALESATFAPSADVMVVVGARGLKPPAPTSMSRPGGPCRSRLPGRRQPQRAEIGTAASRSPRRYVRGPVWNTMPAANSAS